MEQLAQHIKQVLHLPLVMDAPTPGRGNCFFAAICQQLDYRNELGIQNVYSHSQLRRAVCEFALAREHPQIKTLAEEHDATAITLRSTWKVFFTNMKKNGVFAEGPVVHCTAIFLHVDDAVISLRNTPSNPFMLVPGENSITPTGMPPHKLNLKVGFTVMLLRNLCSKRGLCNGVCIHQCYTAR